MVASRRGEEVLDRRIEVQPSSRALKRALLVCFRCIDLDAIKRPKMGQIVHMLEVDDFPFRSVSAILNLLFAICFNKACTIIPELLVRQSLFHWFGHPFLA